jgi:hypothetical protein
MRKALVVLSVVALAGAFASTAAANHSWGGYHWARTANPFTLKVGDNVTATWDAYLNEAVSDWNPSTVLNLTKVTGNARKNCRPTSGRIEVCNASYGNNGWLGIAQIWASGTHITQGVAKMNDTYFNTAQYNTPPWWRLVMCQEVAHDFGLAHQDENFNNANLGSCMDYTSDPSTNTHPNGHDYQELDIIYAQLDTTTTVGASTLPSAMPPAMGQIDFDNPGQWGRLVSRSRNGRSETYELDFGRGNKVVTHVFWADPDNDAR